MNSPDISVFANLKDRALRDEGIFIAEGGFHPPGIILTKTCRVRGPSNSQKKMDCQVPRTRAPFSTNTVSDAPKRDALM